MWLTSLIPLFMSVMARASGGGLFANKVWSRLPEMLFVLPITFFVQYVTGTWYLSLLSFFWSYFMMEMGHGTFYAMNGYHDHNRDPDKLDKPRKQTLEKIFRPVFEFFGGDIMKPGYSWFMMSLKGFLIALPLGLLAPFNAFLWPLAYWIGFKVENLPRSYLAEWISGLFLGTLVALSFLLR